jgi:hypothetical protein
MKSTVRRITRLCFSTVLALALSATAHANTACPMGPTGALECSLSIGSDYFQTQTGTFATFPPPIGVVNFMGNPVGPGSTDTIVQRLNEPTLIPGGGPSTVSTLLTTLSLEGTAPLNIGGFHYSVFVNLDPSHLADDTGTLLVSLNSAANGGTFSSTLNVFFDVSFLPLDGGPALATLPMNITLGSTGTPWSTTPAAGSLLVSGTDGGSGDQAGNIHTGLAPGELDFFTGTFTEGGPGEGHVVSNTPTPEPGSLLLLLTTIPTLRILRRSMLLSRPSR